MQGFAGRSGTFNKNTTTEHAEPQDQQVLPHMFKLNKT
jgi:hypothetical protein